MSRPSLLVLFGLALLAPPARAEQPDARRLDAAVRQAQTAWRLPGVAVGVVRGDEAPLFFAAGHRVAAGKDAVTADTLFAIASLTKAFTAAGLAILVDDGKLSWDDPVRKYLPYFRLADPSADRDVTVRDLLCHRIGLARHDLLWYRAPWSLEETVRRMAHLERSSSFRSRYEYNNLAYIAAGLVVEKASGQPWHEFTSRRLFEPLGMKSAVFTASAARASADHATPHRRDGATMRPISWYPDEKQVRGSGSIKASVRELAAWMRMQLGGGKFGERQVISARSLAATHTPHVVMPREADLTRMTESTQASYGLGWIISDYRGRKVLAHSGSADGFRAVMMLVPDARLGLVVLTNCEEANAVQATGYQLLDLLLGLKEKDWHGFYRKRPAPGRGKQATPPQRRGTRPSLRPAGYEGTYRDAAYGDLSVKREGGSLVLSWSGFRVPLEHYHFDTFQARTAKDAVNGRLHGELATFALGAGGDVASVRFLGRTFRRAS